MMAVNGSEMPAERIVTIGDFFEGVYLPWIELHRRPSTAKGYRDIWDNHLQACCRRQLLKDTRTHHVQGWLNRIGADNLSRNTLMHIKSVVSAIFTLAKQQDYFDSENPARDTAINPGASEPQETYAYTLEEIQTILSRLPEPAGTAFAIASFMGLRHGELRGLLWENYRNQEMQVSRSIWNGHVTAPKTRKGRAPVPVIRQLAERLELHRLRCGNPQTGPIFANQLGKPLAMVSLTNRYILPSLNVCEQCGRPQAKHQKASHPFKRDDRIPEWHGWHAARRGLGSNLYRLGVPDMVIQRILRHANVSTTATYYIKTAAADVRSAMDKLENHIAEAGQTLTDTNGTLNAQSGFATQTVQ
jgi:integrase